MTLLVPVMLFGWVPLSILFFSLMHPRKAVLCIVIGGFLFLPMAQYDLPNIPAYSKITAIALGLIFGGLFTGARRSVSYRWDIYDLPMTMWCFFCPVATSLANGLGLYDGLSSMVQFYLNWGAFYWAGRIYFKDAFALRDLSLGIVIGGLIYIPLCLYEVRMSPQLSNIFYGFFSVKWSQVVRYGGYRPLVFMQHGLMVALWMALSSVASFWLWRSKAIVHLKSIPVSLVVLSLFISTVLCKSANGWFFLFLGSSCYFFYKKSWSVRFFRLLILLIPLYIASRLTNVISGDNVQDLVALFFDRERVLSLSFRLTQEDLFGAKAFLRPFFGWGGWSRGWPVDPLTGGNIKSPIDALWIGTFSANGLIGLSSLYLAMLIGPWSVLGRLAVIKESISKKALSSQVDAVLLSLLVVIFMMDTLLNGMINPLFILCTGALVSYGVALKQKKRPVGAPRNVSC